jgi:drug/metabolite transporter (DMT)-like permease
VTAPRAPHALAGIALALAAVACFAALDTSTKFVSTGVPLLMAMWIRYLFQAVATTLVVLPLRGRSVLRTTRAPLHLLRGVLLASSTLLAFISLKHTPVAEFTAIVMLTPLVVTLLAIHRLGETVSALRWLLVIGGFAGTLAIIRPSADDFNWALLLPLLLVATNTGFQLLTSQMARTEDPMTMHLYTGWVGTLVATLALPFVWVQIDSRTLWAAMGFMGLMATVGHFMLILAYQRTAATVLMPYLYGQIVFAMLLGWLVFSHVPDLTALLGIGLIGLCGVVGAWLTIRESRLRTARPSAPSHAPPTPPPSS